jgi:hypothetical protein
VRREEAADLEGFLVSWDGWTQHSVNVLSPSDAVGAKKQEESACRVHSGRCHGDMDIDSLCTCLPAVSLGSRLPWYIKKTRVNVAARRGQGQGPF